MNHFLSYNSLECWGQRCSKGNRASNSTSSISPHPAKPTHVTQSGIYLSIQHQHLLHAHSYGFPKVLHCIQRGQLRYLCSSHHQAKWGQGLAQSKLRKEQIERSCSPAAGILLQHQLYPSCHHRQFPIAGHKAPPLSQHSNLNHSLIAA